MRILFFSLLGVLSVVFHVSGKVIPVGKSKQFTSIQKAIDFSRNGDTIMVFPGLYKEGNIIIQKSITLLGRGYPVLDGENKYAIISIKAKNAVVKGLKLQHTGRSEIRDLGAIMVYDSDGISVISNILDDTNFGVYVQNSKKCTIKGNSITAYGKDEVQSGNGIHCWHSDSLTIIDNKIKGHRDGLYFEFVKNSLIEKNISTLNVRYGIHFMFSNQNTYIANVFERNGSGVAVMYSKKIHMYKNHFLNNWGDAAYGILLKDITDSDISGNFFTENTVGLHMEGCSRIKLSRNTFNNNGWAVKIQASCDNNDFTKNNFTGNTFDIGTNGSLVLNTFNGNYWDKYEGYDLQRDNIGDISYHPVSMYSMIIDSNPAALMLFRSLIVTLLDKTEKILPGVTPENLKDNKPVMKKLPL
ncbi:nitrous oxide reductase family maturation protein NosD [Pedobacter sp. JCM 36344]|uniref:nitrous oxide reductase family maturation protein NosD n=1 Tax=Pedobacter sp. JCM 36344 TaxID=3374280 RepID=UPI0039785EFD